MLHEGPCLSAVMSGGQMSHKVSQRLSTTLGFVSLGCDILCGRSFHQYFSSLFALLFCSPMIPHMRRT